MLNPEESGSKRECPDLPRKVSCHSTYHTILCKPQKPTEMRSVQTNKILMEAQSLDFWCLVQSDLHWPWLGASHRLKRSSGQQPAPSIFQTMTIKKFCRVCQHHRQWALRLAVEMSGWWRHPSHGPPFSQLPQVENLDSSCAWITHVNPDSTGSQKTWFLIPINLGTSHLRSAYCLSRTYPGPYAPGIKVFLLGTRKMLLESYVNTRL